MAFVPSSEDQGWMSRCSAATLCHPGDMPQPGLQGVLEVGAETHISEVFWCRISITVHESLT